MKVLRLVPFLFVILPASRVEAQNFHLGVGWRTYLTNPSVDNEYSAIASHLGTGIQPPAYRQQLFHARMWFVPLVGLEAGVVFSNVSRTDEDVDLGGGVRADINTSVRNFGFDLRLLIAPVSTRTHRLAFLGGFQFANIALNQDQTFQGGSATVTVKGNVIRIPVGIAAEILLSRSASIEGAITFPIYAGGGFNFEAVSGNNRQTGKVGSFSTVFGAAGLSVGLFYYIL